MTVSYKSPSGVVYSGLDPDDAMKRYADDGCKGKIIKELDQMLSKEKNRVVACIVGYDDDECALVTPISPESITDDMPPRTISSNHISWYKDLGFFNQIVDWLSSDDGYGEKPYSLDSFSFDMEYIQSDPDAALAEAANTQEDDPSDDDLDDFFTDVGQSGPTDGDWKDSGTISIDPEKTKPVVSNGGPRTVDAGTFSQEARDRQDRHIDMLMSIGISPPGSNIVVGGIPNSTTAGYERGTTVIGAGYDNLKTSKNEWDSKPLIEDAGEEFIEVFNKEEREDHLVGAGKLRMDDDGWLVVESGQKFMLEEQGFTTLLARSRGSVGLYEDYDDQYGSTEKDSLFPRAAQYLMQMEPDRRAYNFNKDIAGAVGNLMLRTRQVGDHRSIFAAVTEKYSQFDGDKVVEAVGKALGGKGYRGEIVYNAVSTTLSIDATYHAPSDIVDFAAGDVFQVGFRTKSNDAAGGALISDPQAWWNQCLNMIIIAIAKARGFKIVHKGGMDNVVNRFNEMTEESQEVFAHFADEWGILGETDINSVKLFGQRFSTVDEALSFMVLEGKLGKDIAKDVHLEWLLSSLKNQGGGDTLDSLVNAVTRAAHEHTLNDIQRDVFERRAGMLVPQLVKVAQA